MEDLEFLPNPKLKGDKLSYVTSSKEIYVNLFEIKLEKQLVLYQYPYEIKPDIENEVFRAKVKIFHACKDQLRKIYGECFFLGGSLYSLKKIEIEKRFECSIYGNGKHIVTLIISPKTNQRTLNQNDIADSNSLTKQYYEILIRDILHTNPNLVFYKNLFINKPIKKKKEKNSENIIGNDKYSIEFYPGYTSSLLYTEGGKYLNVTLKSKILETKTIYDYLKKVDYKKKSNHQKIKENLINKKFQVTYSKRNYVIYDISFERNPNNTEFLFDKYKIKLKDYYKEIYGKTIKDNNQPLLIAKGTSPKGKQVDLYFVPELCKLSGIDDNMSKNWKFMKELAEQTKLNPKIRVEKTNEFLNFLTNEEWNPDDEEKLTAKKKAEIYGIQIKPLSKKVYGYYMEKSKLWCDKKKTKLYNPKEKTFPVLIKKDMKNWVCLYRKYNYHKADNFWEKLKEASEGYGFEIHEPEWGELNNDDEIDDWLNKAEDMIKEVKPSFVVFLLDKSDIIYKDLKKHSLCTIGYVSQVVKIESLENKKTVLSVCSKILLQINSKLSGVQYMPELSKDIKERKLMIIGVDSSHIKGKTRGVTGVAMVSTINTSFTNFYNKETIIEEENKEQIQYCISKFIEEALVKYKDLNEQMPKGIIIYRQGVSLQQKKFLKNEVNNIQEICNKKNLLYYYILVNTKTNFKFFEKNNSNYNNPQEGLLIFDDNVIHRNYFEFYIQPQNVTGGSATPTCYHVAYGNLDFPEMVPKLTYDLCYLYNNWQGGAVRVPHVLKSAEKLSKMTAKITGEKLNDKLEKGQSYL